MMSENRRLREELAVAVGRVEALEAENRKLQDRLDAVERAAARQAAPFRREEKKKVPAGRKKRPGRKAGHPGACRAVPKQIDEEVEVPLAECPHCQRELTDRAPLVQYIEEIPPVRPRVTRLVTWQAECPCCGEVRSTHPLQTSTAGGAAAVQLGPRALAVATLLNKQLGVTVRKTCRVMHKLLGLSLTPGGLTQALDRVAHKTESQYEAMLETIRKSDAVFADETSWWVGGPGWWLWVFATPRATLYRVKATRGSQVVKDTLGEDFEGMLVSDCLNSYDAVDYRKHKCIAHHQRAIASARDRPDTKDPAYLDKWKLLFKAVSALWRARPAMPIEAFAAERARIKAAFDRLLNQPVTQPGDVAVQNRLLKQRPHLLGCLDEPAAEPTNNRAERALRPAVIARKLSCGNKTDNGRRTWEILASLAATAAQNADDLLEFLPTHLALAPQPG